MAEINADAETVIQILTEKIARVEQENSILSARLLTAGRLLDEKDKKDEDSSPRPSATARRTR